MHAERVGDAPGLVLGRIVAQLVNEACFAVGEGVGSAADVDAGMVLGLNHPRGPLEWGELSAPTRCSGSSTGCRTSTARSATARPRRSCAQPGTTRRGRRLA